MKKRKISLEEEKRVNDALWKEILDEISRGCIDTKRIADVMHRINMLDYVLIKENRRDLLD